MRACVCVHGRARACACVRVVLLCPAKYNTTMIEIKTAEQYIELTSRPALHVVACGAHWCVPCAKFAPTFARLARKYRRVSFYTLDIDELSDFADIDMVTAVPAFIFVRNSFPLGVIIGGDARAIEELIKKNQ